LITALGIHGVGEVLAADLAQHFTDIDELSMAGLNRLYEIEGVGPNIAQSIVDWFANPRNMHVVQELHALGVWPTSSGKFEKPVGITPCRKDIRDHWHPSQPLSRPGKAVNRRKWRKNN